jgi:hypothetical protein
MRTKMTLASLVTLSLHVSSRRRRRRPLSNSPNGELGSFGTAVLGRKGCKRGRTEGHRRASFEGKKYRGHPLFRKSA